MESMLRESHKRRRRGQDGESQINKNSPATSTCFGKVCESIRIAGFSGNIGVGSMGVAIFKHLHYMPGACSASDTFDLHLH